MLKNVLWLKLLAIALVLLTINIMEVDAAGRVYVKGYYRKDGTYVRPHYRTAPDSNPYNNYSYPGNYNPNTGKYSTGNPSTYLRNYYNRSSKSTYKPKTYIPRYSTTVPSVPKFNVSTPSYSRTTTVPSVATQLLDMRSQLEQQVNLFQRQIAEYKRQNVLQQNKYIREYNAAISKGDYETAVVYAILIDKISPSKFRLLLKKRSQMRRSRW